MRHCTPEDLGLAALGEPLATDDAAHLAGCARCRDEVAALRRSVAALSVPELADPGPPVAPPPGLWAGIAAATGVTVAPRPHVVAASAPPAGVPDSPPVPVAAPAPVAPPAVPGPPPAPVVPLRPRRSRVLLAAAAALVAGLAIGAGAVALRGGDPAGDDPAGGTGVPLAAATLDPLADSDASGRATVVERPDGTRVLEVELAAGAPAEGYYEAWLLTESVSGLIPLGVVRTGTDSFELPADLDLGEYPVVDVSVEQLDGDPTHSGVSVARGQLDT
ncbi:Anti-sigma-K factor rskA [Geodermatophilus dictyosporus]|uniref:Anti-sigma-K factor rskA n=1 Tax=Geodermatophilus dictyosporus TaxID=1523247 RepID=A0A1I5MKB2_9ACTN|nr:anti-sigma factor [Geodermatophilus dictyosporus]SFP09366.1 Anti-sigma-K factor rskA [Geodermatophilus dictyosporus]